MMNDYSVEIVARGEGIVYREGDRTLNFELSRSDRAHCILHAYHCTDAQFHEVRLSPEEQHRVVSRIVAHFESAGDVIEILTERPPQPLRSVHEIAQERLRDVRPTWIRKIRS